MNGWHNAFLPSASTLKAEAMGMKVEENPPYSVEMFLSSYPQFCEKVPSSVVEMWVG